MKSRTKSSLLLLVISFIILIIIYVYYSYPREFNQEYEGIFYRLGDSNLSEEVAIKINGQLARGIWKSDEFTGNLQIGEQVLSKITLQINYNSFTPVFYYDEEEMDYKGYGTLYTEDIKESFTICVDREEADNKTGVWNSTNGYMISTPAGNREEALRISNRLVKKFLQITLE